MVRNGINQVRNHMSFEDEFEQIHLGVGQEDTGGEKDQQHFTVRSMRGSEAGPGQRPLGRPG